MSVTNPSMPLRVCGLVIAIIAAIGGYVWVTPEGSLHDQVVAASSAIVAITAVVALLEVVVSKRNRDRARSYGWLLAALAILQTAATRHRR